MRKMRTTESSGAKELEFQISEIFVFDDLVDYLICCFGFGLVGDALVRDDSVGVGYVCTVGD